MLAFVLRLSLKMSRLLNTGGTLQMAHNTTTMTPCLSTTCEWGKSCTEKVVLAIITPLSKFGECACLFTCHFTVKQFMYCWSSEALRLLRKSPWEPQFSCVAVLCFLLVCQQLFSLYACVSDEQAWSLSAANLDPLTQHLLTVCSRTSCGCSDW